MIHIVGFPVRVGTRFVQRCAWCGEVIEDIDLSRVLVAPNADGSPGPGIMPWEMGALLDVRESSRSIIAHREGDLIPRGCCASKDAKPLLTVVK